VVSSMGAGQQDPTIRFLVIYNKSGTNLTSCVIDRKRIPPFQVSHTGIKPKSFVVEMVTMFYGTDHEGEAHYLCAILNSNVLNIAIKSQQPRGLWGERDITRIPFTFPIPRFDAKNKAHRELASLSKECHIKVETLSVESKSIGRARTEVRNNLNKDLGRIDKLVSQLLDV